MPESHKHQQERPITNRSGQQYPGEIAAGGHATSWELPSKEYAKGRTLAEAREKAHVAFGQSGNVLLVLDRKS